MKKSNISALARVARPARRNKVRAVRTANDIEARILGAIRQVIPPSDAMDAINLLKADHRHMDSLFDRFERAQLPAQKLRLTREICRELTAHAMVEEELFYPIFRGLIDSNMLDEAYVEHDNAKTLIAEVAAGSPSDMFWEAKVKVLAEEVRHHVREEEKWDGIFAAARRTGVDMVAIGRRIAARKHALLTRFQKEGLPTPQTRTMRGVMVNYGQPVDNIAHYMARA